MNNSTTFFLGFHSDFLFFWKGKKAIFLKDIFETITINEVNDTSEQKFNQSIKVETIPFFLFPAAVLRPLFDVEILIFFVEPLGNRICLM